MDRHRRALAIAVGNVSGTEKRFRKLLKSEGLIFGCNDPTLPGTPDLVFPREQLIVFVHGCYWHRHQDCSRSAAPAKDVAYWLSTSNEQVRRDAAVNEHLREMGWEVVVAWECEIDEAPRLAVKRVVSALHTPGAHASP